MSDRLQRVAPAPAAPRVGDQIREARKARGWSMTRLVRELNVAAWSDGLRLMSDASLKTAISRWENGHVRPDEMHSWLLSKVLCIAIEPSPHRRCMAGTLPPRLQRIATRSNHSDD